MKSNIIYLNRAGKEVHDLTKRDLELVSRRSFVKRASLFLPLSFFAGHALTAKAGSTTIQRTISAATETAISMTNSTWARPISLSASWNKVRVGCRMHMTNTGANLTGNPVLVMGLCSGTTNQYGDVTTTHFLGVAWDMPGWSYANLPPSIYVTGVGAAPVARLRIGTTNTDSATMQAGGASQLFNASAASNTTDREIIFIDIVKGSPNYTVTRPFQVVDGVGAAGDVTAANFLNYMGQLAPTPIEGNYTTTLINPRTVAVNEGTNGALNAVNFCWNRVDLAVELCDVAVAVLA